ncbi:restriction endonuclease subunit M [Spirochaetia bacterium]|nr:restriction endonuclease subunit M [Spirochaetia bacterium]
MPQNRNPSVNTRQFNSLNKSIQDLWDETNKRKAIDIGIRVANEVMKVFIPNNAAWQEKLVEGEEALDKVIPTSKLPNQKAETWFVQHPYLGGERIILEHFSQKDIPFESRFYVLNKSSAKARVSAGVHLTKNWENSELTQNAKYKVGINFFLSGDLKRVLIVLSNQGNLRVMELSEHLTHTQIDIFNKLYGVCELKTDNNTNDSSQKLIHTTLWDAFALHELNNKFYAGVASHFEILLQHLIAKKGGAKDSEDAKLFVSRLLGRLLFIWFLRKKNIVSESYHYFDKVDDVDGSEYYDKYLKQLFFKTLNIPIKDRKSKDDETPYLNGGLFEYHKNDWVDEKLSFPPDWFQTLYKHFDAFNFTTDESSPEYEQVAIDPEMLGRVFESLLATQIGETGEQARKEKGAFYTPREIVTYMCKESLRQYLYTGIKNPVLNAGVDSLLDKNDAEFETAHTNAKRDLWGIENTDKVSRDVITLLDKIKILDPACGSGAFPMGMVQLLEKIYERLEPRFDRYKTKLTVIQNNIYGVDIEPMAVEIARLRAWLSIIVNEEDPHSVKPLPNLDFKFVCANSLIALEKEADLFDDITIIDRLLQIIQEYMNLHDPVAKEKKIQEYQDTVKQLTHDAIDKPQYVTKKAKQILSWNPKQDMPSIFFDSAIMFAMNDGFDIVIGNPPWGAKFSDADKEYFKTNYITAKTIRGVQKGSLDTFALFIDKGYSLCKKFGSLHFIVPMSVISSDSMSGLHNLLFNNCNDIKASSFCDRPLQVFKNAHKKTSIVFFNKTETPCKTLLTTQMYRWSKEKTLDELIKNLRFIDSFKYRINGRFPKVSLPIERDILAKLFDKNNTPIEKLISKNGNPIYYRSSGGMYYNVITNYPSGSTKEKPIIFNKKDSNVIGAALSSNLFFWFQQVYSNGLDLKSYEIESFTIPMKKLTDILFKQIDKLYSEYLVDIEKNVIIHQTESYQKIDSFKEYKIRKSKNLIDKIDDVICPLYGLTKEETDFIKNYEIEFRVDEDD